MKITPLSGRHIRIGRRLHVNQPLQLLQLREASKILFVFRFSHSFYAFRTRFTQHAQTYMAFTVKIMANFFLRSPSISKNNTVM